MCRTALYRVIPGTNACRFAMDPKVNEDRFKYIAEHSDNEWIVRTAVRLSEKFSACGSCLQTCTRMAYVLYLLGKTDLALVAASAVEDVPFENDYDRWTWVEALLVLKSRVERMNGDASLQTRLRTVIKPAVYRQRFAAKSKPAGFQPEVARRDFAGCGTTNPAGSGGGKPDRRIRQSFRIPSAVVRNRGVRRIRDVLG